jgi:outer membrane biogenesis lipoprotein LolB
MRQLCWLVLITGFVLLVACDAKNEVNEDNHVWKEKTDTIKKAEQVEKMMQDAVQQKMRAVDEQE